MFRKNKKENKAKLEHKLYLARETPEPIFDLSDCGITNVPSGIYSLCRVFLKECLKLDHNNLSSLSGGGNLQDLHLLKILDIHENNFNSLPDNIDCLVNLKVLLVSKNRLKKLPFSLCNMRHLEILDVSHNKLWILPDNLGHLCNLRELNVRHNRHLDKLPESLCSAMNLTKIELDSENFEYPPSEIAADGTEAIMKYIRIDTGFRISDETDNPKSPDSGTVNLDDLNFQAKIWRLENIKEQKVRDFMEIERQNELAQQWELQVANALKVDKQKLLDDITEQQSKFDTNLAKIQEERDVERFKLVEQLQAVEENADAAITKLLKQNKEPLAQLLEMEMQEEARIVKAATACSNQLRKDDILKAMQDLLEQEATSFDETSQLRIEAAQKVLEREQQSNDNLARLLDTHILKQSELVAKLQEDSDLQKAAVCALLERGDARSWGLVQQVRLVEAQLAALTAIEMDRRRLEVDEQINDLSEKRANLSNLLMELIHQQAMRKLQLCGMIKLLEERGEATEDYWLLQYQILMDRMPTGILGCQKNMSPALVEALLMAGVWHCIPFLVKWSNNERELLEVTDKDLKESGLVESRDRQSILEVFHMYKKQKYAAYNPEVKDVTPSAPVEEAEGASAPPMETVGYVTSECVICLDCQCETIFLPCGHFCCCTNCGGSVAHCPLCRGDIDQKIRVRQA